MNKFLEYIEEDSKEENIISIKRKGPKVEFECKGSLMGLKFTFAQLCKELTDNENFDYDIIEELVRISKKFI